MNREPAQLPDACKAPGDRAADARTARPLRGRSRGRPFCRTTCRRGRAEATPGIVLLALLPLPAAAAAGLDFALTPAGLALGAVAGACAALLAGVLVRRLWPRQGGAMAARDTAPHAPERELLERLAARVPGVIYQYLVRADGSSSMPWASEGLRDIYDVTPAQARVDAGRVFAAIHPDDRADVQASIAASARKLEPWRQVYRVVLPGRGTRWVRGETSRPERRADGSTLWHGYITDITASRETQLANQRLAAIVAHSHDFVAVTDSAGGIEFVNLAGRAMVGLGSGPAADTLPSLDKLVHASAGELLESTIRPALARDGHWSGDVPFRDLRDGSAVPTLTEMFRIDGHPSADGTGSIAVVSRDLGDRVRAEQALRDKLYQLSSVVAGVP
ncbi:MAG: PAS domain-containing protein, partial [Gammaproteobacteria bacterium]